MLEGDDPRGILPKQADRSPASALDGPVRLVPNSITPDFWAVNTMTPPYAPTYDLDPKRPGYADWSDAKTLVPQHHATIGDRSEEHTSELQSLMRISYAVFCLKKKKQTKHTQLHQTIQQQQI